MTNLDILLGNGLLPIAGLVRFAQPFEKRDCYETVAVGLYRRLAVSTNCAEAWPRAFVLTQAPSRAQDAPQALLVHATVGPRRMELRNAYADAQTLGQGVPSSSQAERPPGRLGWGLDIVLAKRWLPLLADVVGDREQN